ncbi:LuxR C-terminal-related transcriptional regulator [Isoptericola halotolerans]|uniref:LuxR C-terminal-related transcriptional regulator n=1 Tax=Isoptericola halotolerans TaxID=300560 RepID=UPI00388D11A9
MPGPALTSNAHGEIVALTRTGRAVLITGPPGIGKSHLLRAVAADHEGRGGSAPVLSACGLGREIPLGVFSGLPGIDPAEQTPAGLVDVLTRRRSTTLLLVDDVEHLDDASLFVVGQLLRRARLRAVLTARDLAALPETVGSLYDAGDLDAVRLEGLDTARSAQLLTDELSGPVTPATLPRLVAATGGNPLHLREVVRGSLDEGRLVPTPHGWELVGDPVPTTRLAQALRRRFDRLDEAAREAAAVVAIAGECPPAALDDALRRALVRAGVVDVTTDGRLQLAGPLDGEALRAAMPAALWRDLTAEAVRALRDGDAASAGPGPGGPSRRRAALLALDLGEPFDVAATLDLARLALAAHDDRLAFRAANAALGQAPDAVEAHRIAGLAASGLGDTEQGDRYLDAAQDRATTPAEQVAVALARAHHHGLHHRDATGARTVLEETLARLPDGDDAAHLRRAALRWRAVAGATATTPVEAPSGPTDAETTYGMIMVAMSGVVTGPLEMTERLVDRLRRAPAEMLAQVPAGSLLVELADAMALSYTGDVQATRRRVRDAIAAATEQTPEAVGAWQYALGLTELLAADAEEAFALATDAVSRLQWRDVSGVLPAALALAGAAAQATGRTVEARKAWDALPGAASGDPKVVMLRTWGEAWRSGADGYRDRAAEQLVDSARWLLAAQHTYLAGMLAHCAVRIDRQVSAATSVLDDAVATAGGGLLQLLARHGRAAADGDLEALSTIADEANELGLVTTATDTWLALADHLDRRRRTPAGRRHRVRADALRSQVPGMATWRGDADRKLLLSARELQVVRLAAERYPAKEIAAVTGTSPNTVTNQLSSAFRKLGVRSRAELRECLAAGPDRTDLG